MQVTPREFLIYRTADGRLPFSEWLASLHDGRARAKIRVRLDRVSLGNFGNCHSVGEGVHELRIEHGQGYRVYFGQLGSTIVLLPYGGDKIAPAKHVELAKLYWSEYKRRA